MYYSYFFYKREKKIIQLVQMRYAIQDTKKEWFKVKMNIIQREYAFHTVIISLSQVSVSITFLRILMRIHNN